MLVNTMPPLILCDFSESFIFLHLSFSLTWHGSAANARRQWKP
jgi:hypothetical protein